jgi:asparagine synthase (glutamine-hydrolysing)
MIALNTSTTAAETMKGFADVLLVFGGAEVVASPRVAVHPWQTRAGHPKWDLYSTPTGGGSHLAALFHENHSDAWDLWLVGELYGYRDRDNTLGTETLLSNFSADLIAGRAAPQTLNGHFLLLGWNRERREWHAWIDRLGTYHAYYASDGRRAAIGTFFSAVAEAASRRRLDWLGVSGFFAFGFFPQERTYYDDVRIMRPATHNVFDENGQLVHESRYWDWHYDPDRQRCYADTVEEFGERLVDILADQTRFGRIALPISGGLDSRTVAAIVSDTRSEQTGQGSQQIRPWSSVRTRLWAYSYGYTDYSVETAIGARIAAARGVPFQRFTIPPYLFDRLDLILASVEGFQGVASTRQAAIVDDVADHADYLLAAHWGDVWMDDMGLLDKPASELSEISILDHTLHKIEKRGRQWLLEQVCSPQLGGNNPEGALRDLVGQELRRVQHIDEPDFRVKAFKTEQWSFRWTTASLRMFQPGAFVRLPFYDNRMVDFCCTVPSNFVRGRRLQIDYLKRFHPDLARITWEVTDSSLFTYQHYETWLLPKRAWKKLWRATTGRRHIGRNWEVLLLNEQGKAGLQEWLLRPGLKMHEFVSPAAVRGLVDEFLTRPSAGNGYTISSLLTFSTWLERYG